MYSSYDEVSDLRRERERHGYLALHSLLPLGTKILILQKDKITRLCSGGSKENSRAGDIQRGLWRGEMVKLKRKLAGSGIVNVESTKIRIEVANQTAGVVLLWLDVLKCFEELGSKKPRSIQSQISDQQLCSGGNGH
ncbi:hypothetical protein NC653_024860 [Populus alba x Populus x berolinensis]|uniref:Uncharacterized protein n=1 Tax=Populus alba x Populus x berolinensis TaxID=444605 RepID=A0AAD6Q7A5_9ROSI|nr:hypothetical protein NC653_024860 [Populus alba x Populus x berolinensis]